MDQGSKNKIVHITNVQNQTPIQPDLNDDVTQHTSSAAHPGGRKNQTGVPRLQGTMRNPKEARGQKASSTTIQKALTNQWWFFP